MSSGDASKLRKDLGLGSVFNIASGAMISSGLFILPGLAHAMAGPAVIFSYFFGGLLACCGMLSIAEMITAMPKAGGDYFVVNRTMGPAVGTVTGLLVWFSLALKTSFALLGMSVFAQGIIPIDMTVLGASLCILFFLLNLMGVKKAARLQNILVIVLLAVLFMYCMAGLPHVNRDYLFPFAPNGWDAVFATSGMIFVSFGGLLNTAAVAEEVDDPGRNLPLGMILALLMVSMLYTLTVFVTTGVLPAEELDFSLTPISDGAGAFLGRSGSIALSIAALTAFISTANAGLLAASRYLLALSRDNLAPPALGKINKRFGTPHVALTITAATVIASLLLDLKVLAGAASTVLILTFILANFSVIVLRESSLFHYRPTFHTPLYPWLQIAGIVGSFFMLAEMGAKALFLGACLVTLGLFFYWFYGRIRAGKEYALKLLIRRITDEKRYAERLERELKTIIREREGITADRFDALVENAIFVDLDEGKDVSDMTGRVVDGLVDKWKIDPLEVTASIRAHLSSDTFDEVAPDIGVGEVEIGCQGVFDLVIIRDRKYLEGAGGKFHALFLFVTCRGEERMFIKSVAALAQILLAADFEAEFLSAEDERRVKDLLLLGRRRRGLFEESLPY
jgi:amino acid transporter